MITSPVPLLIVIAAIVVLAVTGNLFSESPLIIVLQIAAIGLSVWARRSFQSGTFRVSAAPGGTAIISRGPYRWVRHPMYAAALLFIWTAALGHVSAFTVGVGMVVTVSVIARVIAEERLLVAQLPGYEEYRRSTGALLPFVM
jgi:protein-S-isoprenylcysteine O-methyltransferase Ste14